MQMWQTIDQVPERFVQQIKESKKVTILDKIKTVLAQSGTHIQGYNDNLSVDKITEITGNSGYAESIAKELSYADVPVTQENLEEIDKIVDQALTAIAPTENSIIYMIGHHMEPTLGNLYKAEHSSGNLKQTVRMIWIKIQGNKGYEDHQRRCDE